MVVVNLKSRGVSVSEPVIRRRSITLNRSSSLRLKLSNYTAKLRCCKSGHFNFGQTGHYNFGSTVDHSHLVPMDIGLYSQIFESPTSGAMTDIRLYGNNHSPWVQAVMMGLYQKKMQYSRIARPPLEVFKQWGPMMPAASFDGEPL